jgi:hypothetical protein
MRASSYIAFPLAGVVAAHGFAALAIDPAAPIVDLPPIASISTATGGTVVINAFTDEECSVIHAAPGLIPKSS